MEVSIPIWLTLFYNYYYILSNTILLYLIVLICSFNGIPMCITIYVNLPKKIRILFNYINLLLILFNHIYNITYLKWYRHI